MAKRLSPCAEPGCPTLTARTRCDEHTRQQRRTTRRQYQRNDYGPTWPAVRARQLRDEPTCRGFPAPCGRPATVVDHIVPIHHFPTTTAAHQAANLQSLCTSCHNRKTATTDSAFGRNH